MTVSPNPYYHWNSRSDSLVAPYNSCSPNLLSLQDYYRRRWGAISLGCHNQRDVSGGGSLSTHAWGAACDPKFPNRSITVEAMDWTIAWSAELGINTIHDYIRQMMWKPGGVGWVSASIGSVGGAWIHVETTPAMFGDGRPVEAKLPQPAPPPPGDDFMTPEDQKYLDAKFAALPNAIWNDISMLDRPYAASVFLVGAHDAAQGANGNAFHAAELSQQISDQIAALALVAGDPEAVKVAVEEIVRNVLNNTVLEVRPPS